MNPRRSLDEQRIVVRSTKVADAAAMAQVRARSWLAAYPNPEHGISRDWIQQYTNSWLTTEALEKAKENIQRGREHPNVILLVAEIDGAVVGELLGVRRHIRTEVCDMS